jgi:phospholipid/cholesterol/gamma-HCH transport system permease protein
MKNLKNQQARYRIFPKIEEGGLAIELSGEFDLKNLTAFSKEISGLIDASRNIAVTFDFSGVSYMDSAAALSVLRFRKQCTINKIDCRLINFPEKIGRIFAVIDYDALERKPLRTNENHDGAIILVGESFLNIINDIKVSITFFGGLLTAVAYAVFHPRSLRSGDFLFYVKQAGVNGLPIVGLIGLLIGLIIAFMSFLQLRMFGANMYVPALVSFAMVKELGPIMTAILVAGRSGSAFAAEIGTMVVNEEVDALRTMGFDPVAFLAVPKIFALIVVVPVLTLYADLFGIIGGLTVGVVGLDMSFNTYITQSLKAVIAFDVATSLIKAAVFAALIAGIGCQRGFQARSGAQDVGRSTTSAVVTAIFMIVVVDSLFAIVLYYLR